MATVTDTTRAPAGRPPPGAADILSLPFVRDLARPRRRTGSRRHFWMPDCAGLGYLAACDLGRDHALRAVRLMAAEDCGFLLGWAARDMPPPRTAGEKGAQVGFLSVFADLATARAATVGMDRIERAFAERRAALARLLAEEAASAAAGEVTADA